MVFGFNDNSPKNLGDCTIYDLSTIFKHQEISKENTFGQLEQLKEPKVEVKKENDNIREIVNKEINFLKFKSQPIYN